MKLRVIIMLKRTEIRRQLKQPLGYLDFFTHKPSHIPAISLIAFLSYGSFSPVSNRWKRKQTIQK